MFVLLIIVLLGLSAYVVLRRRGERSSSANENGAPLWATVTSRSFMLPLAAVVVAVISTNLVTNALVEADGAHARGHLASAQSGLLPVFLLAASFWALRRDLRRPLLWAAALVTLVGVAILVAGNLQVVSAVRSEASTAAASAPDREREIDDGHGVTSTGMLITQLGAAGFALALVVRKRAIGIGTAIGSAALSIVFPPWIIPGAGLFVVAGALVSRANRRDRYTAVAPVTS
jgi:drug/metabolite transporter (DMT)-like permease